MMTLRWYSILKSLCAVVLAVGLTTAVAAADRLVLIDGTVVEGQVSRTGNRYGVITDSGVQWFDADQVERVILDPLKAADPTTRAAFLAVKAEAFRQDSPAQAIALWKTYITRNPDGPLLETARAEILRWEKAEALGLVVWGRKLVRPEERDASQRKAVELIDTGISLYRDQKFTEARKAFDKAAGRWPGHATVNYYSGLVLRHLRQPLAGARRLVRVLDALPQHVPTQNNLACICSQLTDYRSAVLMLAKALSREPENETLLANAWEMLHQLDVAKPGPVLRLELARMSKANLQVLRDAVIAHRNRMTLQDRYRWGSEWISKSKLDGYIADQKAVQKRLDEMQKELQLLSAKIKRIDIDIQVTQQSRAALIQAGDVRSALVFQEKLKDLNEERRRLVDAQNVIKANARDWVKTLSKPEWSGKMVMMDITRPADTVGKGPLPDQAIRTAVLTGQLRIVGGDGTFLGRVSVEPHHPRSIWNALGPHGSAFSGKSIFDPRSPYGRPMSYLSHRDTQATHPPHLMLGDRRIAYLTTNAAHSPRVTLESLIAALRKQK
jgi:tetratricopeptide (TPR) repeat protein